MIGEEIFSVIFGLISVLLSFIGYYFYVKSELYRRTEDAVNNAETQETLGREKLKIATEQLYMTVPALFKPFFTKEQVELIVQNAFDKIEEYAKKQK